MHHLMTRVDLGIMSVARDKSLSLSLYEIGFGGDHKPRISQAWNTGLVVGIP